jgi:toxin ParE1/3/4
LRVRFTPSARLQFLEAIAYIRRDNASASRRFREKAQTSLRRLEDFPESGRKIPEFPDLPHRELIIEKYRFFYRVEKKTVWIMAVWHSAQETSQPDE